MEKIAQMRFRSQQLATPAFKCPRDLVAWMGAVQAQDYDMSKWAVGMRIEGERFGWSMKLWRRGKLYVLI